MLKIHTFLFILGWSLNLLAQGGCLSLQISLAPVWENGLNLTRISATLTRENDSRTQDLAPTRTYATGCFDNLAAAEYTLNIEIFDTHQRIAQGSGAGVITLPDTHYVTARLVPAGEKLILIVNWHPDVTLKTTDFYNFSISRQQHHLKLYRDLNEPTVLAENYRVNRMPWFFPCEVDSSILDSNLIPIKHYYFGDYRNPVTICCTAFGFYQDYLDTGAEIDYKGFLNNVDWLLTKHDANYYLHYDFDWYHYPALVFNKGWISAMAQGGALGAASMAWFLTADTKYLPAAVGFFTTLYHNSNSFWCIGVDPEDYYWLEEYPNPDFCHVLNGMLFALWGLWDYYVISADDFALTLFQAGLKTIADNYPIWNVPDENLSYYCLHHTAHASYHQIHLQQLELYAAFFDIPEFRDAITCFSRPAASVALDPIQSELPEEILIFPNYLNPFHTTTTIDFYLYRDSKLTCKIWNLLGQVVVTLIDAEKKRGQCQVTWNGKDDLGVEVADGVYLYTMATGYSTKTGKMIRAR